jgi:ABC-type branched-subunit amino acid transport system substrate-binding protein
MLFGIAGCVEATVKEQPEFRKFEPKPQTSQAEPEKAAPRPEPVAPSTPATKAPEVRGDATPSEPQAKPKAPPASKEARVAILLPLSGASAPLGKAMLDSAQLSMFELADKSFVLMPFDTGGTLTGAKKAAVAAVKARARLILGPLHAESVRAVAPVARGAGIPVVAFSNSREVAGDGVFILGFVPRQQVRAVVGYALAEGLSRLAVLAPRDAYGNAVVDAARSLTEAAGGSVVRTMYYAPDAADLSGEVKAFANYNTRRQALLAQRKALSEKGDEVARQALRRLERLDTIGGLPYDAVLLPEGGERLRTLSSLLSYYDVDQPAVRLLGLRSWDLIANLGSEPALIGAWFSGSPAEERSRFGARFRKAFGRPPPRLATLAYDATALAVVLAQGENGPDYSMKALTDSNGFLGVDGIFRLRPEGIAERAFTIHEVTRNGTSERRSAPQSFAAATN